MNGYEIVGFWKTMSLNWCFLCGKQLVWAKYTIIPACEWYNPGGFCDLEFGACVFEDCVLCSDCDVEPVVYVGDACIELGGPYGQHEEEKYGYEEEDYYWGDPMDEVYNPT